MDGVLVKYKSEKQGFCGIYSHLRSSIVSRIIKFLAHQDCELCGGVGVIVSEKMGELSLIDLDEDDSYGECFLCGSKYKWFSLENWDNVVPRQYADKELCTKCISKFTGTPILCPKCFPRPPRETDIIYLE